MIYTVICRQPEDRALNATSNSRRGQYGPSRYLLMTRVMIAPNKQHLGQQPHIRDGYQDESVQSAQRACVTQLYAGMDE